MLIVQVSQQIKGDVSGLSEQAGTDPSFRKAVSWSSSRQWGQGRTETHSFFEGLQIAPVPFITDHCHWALMRFPLCLCNTKYNLWYSSCAASPCERKAEFSILYNNQLLQLWHTHFSAWFCAPTILGAAHQLNMHLIALAILLITNRGLLLWPDFPNAEELNSNDFSGN